MNKVIFITPPMKIVSTEERFSKKTEKPYIVVKASHYSEKRPLDFMKKKYQHQTMTFLCFKETLMGLFEEDNIHIFHGEIEPTWGSTFLHIESLFDEEGRRLLRPQEKKTIELDSEGNEAYTGEDIREENIIAQEMKRRAEEGWPCSQDCDNCTDMECDVNLPY
ncbi:MAG: hypothetical protein V3V31_10885 [Methylococcales bacterium]